ncbi:MAG: cytochrome c biogenesis protein CcsA, partial [Lewinella sp.]|nr:cytochrome c biogenesis protein CcsA [Lewinella sp.]
VQIVLLTMILGLYVGFGDDPVRIGSNPLLLLRDTMDAPIFSSADYVSQLQGTGLNPLLQNWWMTIHPPTLFLGFASTVVPFAFAIGGLWLRDHRGWLQPALPWALFSGAILGTGILMGGAWAYEALSFGGYWAWDPVENMSLVPWLTLIAGIHTNLVARNTDHSIRSSYIFYALTFVLIVYSTFLTRSGVLGETSVHAFTEMGLEWQLVGFILVYLLLSIWLLASRYKGIPSPEKEETTGSKEFWMFIGSLVLLFSAVLITASTSLPVYNKIREFFNPGFLGHVITDPIPHYNKYQLWIGVFVGMLSGFSQYLRFRERDFSKHKRAFYTRLGVSMALSVVLMVVSALWIQARAWQYGLLLFSGWFAVVTNIDYLLFFLRGHLKLGGSVLAHVGFGLMLVGILASSLNKHVISQSPFLMDGLTADEESKRNTLLLFEGIPTPMGDYEVTLLGDTMQNLTRTYLFDYKRRNTAGDVVESFQLSPNILYDKSFERVAASNPDTKQYLHRDIFTHIAALAPSEQSIVEKRTKEDSLRYKTFTLRPGASLTFQDTVQIKNPDTFTVRQYQVELVDMTRDPRHPEYEPEEGDLAVGATLRIHSSENDSVYTVQPILVLRGQMIITIPAQINPLNTRVKLDEETIDYFYTNEASLDYQPITLKQGETTTFGDLQVSLGQFSRQVDHPRYTPREDDIAVAAPLTITDPEGSTYQLNPVFFVRDGELYNLKEELAPLNLHVRFVSIDPDEGTAQLYLARAPLPETRAVFSVATDAFRTDWVALQAIIFPGINIFWLGSSLMMFGLTLSMVHRIQTQRHVA